MYYTTWESGSKILIYNLTWIEIQIGNIAVAKKKSLNKFKAAWATFLNLLLSGRIKFDTDAI